MYHTEAISQLLCITTTYFNTVIEISQRSHLLCSQLVTNDKKCSLIFVCFLPKKTSKQVQHLQPFIFWPQLLALHGIGSSFQNSPSFCIRISQLTWGLPKLKIREPNKSSKNNTNNVIDIHSPIFFYNYTPFLLIFFNVNLQYCPFV